MAFASSSASLHTSNFVLSSSSSLDPQTHRNITLLSKPKTIGDIKQLHCHVIKSGDTRFALGKLVEELCALSSSSDALAYALSVFDELDRPSVYTWNTLIRSLALVSDEPESALRFYLRMLLSGAEPNSHTFPIIFKLCAKLGATREGKQTQARVLKLGLCSDDYVKSSLITFYSQIGDLGCARKVFDESPVRNKVCFTAMMTGFNSSGLVDEARSVFDAMEEEQRDTVAWNAMASGYFQSGRFDETLKLFDEMLRSSKEAKPNERTVMTVLSACAQSRSLEFGNRVWRWAKEEENRGKIKLNNLRLKNSLVEMFSKCGDSKRARVIFDGMSEKNIVSWNVMIGGYTHCNDHKEALSLFSMMMRSDISPNEVTLLAIIPACAHLGCLEIGKWIHSYAERNLGTRVNALLWTSLVDMYSKCGAIEAAKQVFEGIKVKTTAAFNAMISGLAMNGRASEAFELFSRMLDEGFKPDDITFVAILSACNHSGSVDLGRSYFESMTREHEISPKLQHYGIVIDLFGRSGLFKEAEALIESMEIEPDGAIWGSLLGACRAHNRVELGESVARRLFELEPENPGPYVLLSNIYARAGKWDDVATIRTRLHEKGMKKIPGCTSIEIDNEVHEFLVGDRAHPMSEQIYEMGDEIERVLEESGFVPETSEVLYDVDEESKEVKLSHHSERLAIAFGLISTKPGTTIRIVKNLRVCGNCHSATKLISKIFDREIVARDRNRFHQFKDGFCSCNDYW